MIITSYPYLALSKKYEKDYGEIIDLAWSMQQGYPVRHEDFTPLHQDILYIQSQHRAIQSGHRDWLNGYSIASSYSEFLSTH